MDGIQRHWKESLFEFVKTLEFVKAKYFFKERTVNLHYPLSWSFIRSFLTRQGFCWCYQSSLKYFPHFAFRLFAIQYLHKLRYGHSLFVMLLHVPAPVNIMKMHF